MGKRQMRGLSRLLGGLQHSENGGGHGDGGGRGNSGGRGGHGGQWELTVGAMGRCGGVVAVGRGAPSLPSPPYPPTSLTSHLSVAPIDVMAADVDEAVLRHATRVPGVLYGPGGAVVDGASGSVPFPESRL